MIVINLTNNKADNSQQKSKGKWGKTSDHVSKPIDKHSRHV